jgi:hypothetical protein
MLPSVRQLHHTLFRRPRLPIDYQNEHHQLHFQRCEVALHSDYHQLHGRHGDLSLEAVDDYQSTKLVNLHPDGLCRLHQLVRHDVRWLLSLLRGLHVPDVLCSGVPDVVQS